MHSHSHTSLGLVISLAAKVTVKDRCLNPRPKLTHNCTYCSSFITTGRSTTLSHEFRPIIFLLFTDMCHTRATYYKRAQLVARNLWIRVTDGYDLINLPTLFSLIALLSTYLLDARENPLFETYQTHLATQYCNCRIYTFLDGQVEDETGDGALTATRLTFMPLRTHAKMRVLQSMSRNCHAVLLLKVWSYVRDYSVRDPKLITNI